MGYLWRLKTCRQNVNYHIMFHLFFSHWGHHASVNLLEEIFIHHQTILTGRCRSNIYDSLVILIFDVCVRYGMTIFTGFTHNNIRSGIVCMHHTFQVRPFDSLHQIMKCFIKNLYIRILHR